MEQKLSKEEKQELAFAFAEMTAKMVETTAVLKIKINETSASLDAFSKSIEKLGEKIDESFERIINRQGDSVDKITQSLERLDALLASNHTETMSQLEGIEASMRVNNK